MLSIHLLGSGRLLVHDACRPHHFHMLHRPGLRAGASLARQGAFGQFIHLKSTSTRRSQLSQTSQRMSRMSRIAHFDRYSWRRSTVQQLPGAPRLLLLLYTANNRAVLRGCDADCMQSTPYLSRRHGEPFRPTPSRPSSLRSACASTTTSTTALRHSIIKHHHQCHTSHLAWLACVYSIDHRHAPTYCPVAIAAVVLGCSPAVYASPQGKFRWRIVARQQSQLTRRCPQRLVPGHLDRVAVVERLHV